MKSNQLLSRSVDVGASLFISFLLLGAGAALARIDQSSISTPIEARPDTRGSPAANRNEAVQLRVDRAYGKLPLIFEANQGQVDDHVRFISRGRGSTLFLTSTEAVLMLTRSGDSPAGNKIRSGKLDPIKQRPAQPKNTSGSVVRMKLVGANREARITGLKPLPGTVNHFIGKDPSRWRTNVPTYASVEYRDVYPGVNLVYYGNQRQLEYDFVVAPGADPSVIRLAFEGADKLTLDPQGNLILHTAVGEVVQRAPLVYQESSGVRREVSGRYVLQGRRVGFQVSAYDTTKPLVIDPVLFYSTYLGGGANDDGRAIAVDTAGNAYVAGTTASPNFPTTAGALQTTPSGGDLFVTKLNSTGSGLIYSTYLRSNGGGGVGGIAVDGFGNAYVAGASQSTDFPTTPGAFQTVYRGGDSDAFVVKLSPTGSALIYSTYLGGQSTDFGFALAVDGGGNAYVTGFTASGDFPIANAVQSACASAGCGVAFVTKLNQSGSALVYSTYLGGSGNFDNGTGVAVDSSGSAYVTGSTNSSDFPTTTVRFDVSLVASGTPS